jgi:acetaldehyde dehydrogenase (acetylating)
MQKQALAKLLLTPNWTVNPKCVGQPAAKIARMAGFEVPPETSILVVELEGVGKEYPLSAEKLSPVLSLYFRKDFAAALDTCEALLRFGGLGHTSVIHSQSDERIREYGLRMPAMRILVNTPAPHGSTGITTNVFPAMTLGCGALAGNITSDNIGPMNLLNIKRLAYAVHRSEEAFEASAGTPDRQMVSQAVDRYLAARGINTAATSSVAAEVVDRFLAAKANPASVAPKLDRIPDVQPVNFVCEDDVRQAIRDGRKIYIRPKTIITPSARDLAAPGDILVLAER